MTASPKDFDPGVNLRIIFLRLIAAKRWLLASTTFLTVIFAIVAFVMTPVYRSSAVLVAAENEGAESGMLMQRLGGFASIAALAGINIRSGGGKDEAIAVLKSRDFLERFIEEKNLRPVLFEDDWDVSRQAWKDPEEEPSLALAHRTFLEDVLKVSEDVNTGLVTVSVDWPDRMEAADLANELVARLNSEMRRRALIRAEASLKYLENELATTSQVGVREAISGLIEGQVNRRMLANVTEEYAFRVVDYAAPADPDDPIRPKRALLIVLGGFLGAALGVLGVLLVDAFRSGASGS